MSSAVDRTSPMSAWLIGLFLGAIDAVMLLELGYIGVGFTLVFVGLIVWKGPRLPAAAGLITGLGLFWTLAFARVMFECAVENATPGRGCEAGDIGGWVAVAAGITLVGAIATVVAARRLRAR